MKGIAYNGGYKYQLKATYCIPIDIKPATPINIQYINLDTEGKSTISRRYAWDRPSGPTIDTLTFMREGHLDHNVHRDASDRILQKICKEDGMWFLLAEWVYQGVRFFADIASDPADSRSVTRAPKGCKP